jgi:uncharacterized protein YjbJ (UPF0337 family)
MAKKDLSDRGRENELRGVGEQIKGRVKDAAGGLTDDGSLQAEGKWDKTKGKVREKFGQVQQDVGNRVDRARDEDDL